MYLSGSFYLPAGINFFHLHLGILNTDKRLSLKYRNQSQALSPTRSSLLAMQVAPCQTPGTIIHIVCDVTSSCEVVNMTALSAANDEVKEDFCLRMMRGSSSALIPQIGVEEETL